MDDKNKDQGKPFRVSVEGNIGSGKSTLIQHFAGLDDVDTHSEPVNLWKNVCGHNLLELLYQDLKRWNLVFQHYVQLSRVKIQTENTNNRVKLFERSLQNNRFCFVEMAHNSKLLSDPEYEVACSWYDWISKHVDIGIDLIVYLRSSPEVVYDRIQHRGRPEERPLPLSYLQQLHQAYETWLLHHAPAPVLTLDADLDLASVTELYQRAAPYILGHQPYIAEVAGSFALS